MEDKIINIIADVCDYDEIRENMDIDLIDNDILDSFAFLQLILRLNNEFGIEIQPTQVESKVWRNVSSIVKLVEEHLKG